LIEIVENIWQLLEPYSEFLAAILLSLVTAGLLAIFKPRVKLTWGSTSVSVHNFRIREDGEPIRIATEKLFVQNIGKKAAKDIELILNNVPTSYTLWSPREHSSCLLDGGGFSIKIPTLAPNELLIVDTIDIDRRNLHLVAVNCPDAIAVPVRFMAQRQFGKVVNSIVFYLMFAGLVGTIYLVLALFFGGD